jgi:phosphatidate cytidylyltransferase
MIRLASALVLLALVLGVIWYLPPIGTFVLGGVVLVLTFVEYAALARQLSPGFPALAAGLATLIVYTGINAGIPLADVLVPIFLAIALLSIARGKPEEDVLRAVSVALLPVIYLGATLGVSILVRTMWGASAVLLPILVVGASDTAQYYGGRSLGRRPLSPSISPKKTVEGAITGMIAATAAAPIVGLWVFPSRSTAMLAVLGFLLGAIGLCGDLFESLLKRSTGVKDSSGLIPGHGGMLDRVDSLLFAGPVYYLFLRYAGW